MTTEQKAIISNELYRLAGDGKKKKDTQYKFSQVELSVKLGVSNATVSNMISGKWTNISEAMWRKVQGVLKLDMDWQIAKTNNYQLLTELLKSMQEQSLTAAVSYNAGVGKSQTYIEYERYNDNVIYVECKNYWQTKSYIKALLNACGIKAEGTKEEMIETFVEYVMGLDKPLIIIDQMDKLKEGAFDLFMDLYNDLFRCCGFLISGVPALEKRIKRGAKIDKIGYREVLSRINNSFIKLTPIDLNDVKEVCVMNGLDDEDEISRINDLCNGDLRFVRKEINKYFLLKKSA